MSGTDLVSGSPSNDETPGVTYNDDNLDMCTQGSTQWDGLAHVAVEDTHYNGYWTGNVTAATGAAALGIHHQRTSFVGRGVLLDVARHRGVDSLEPGSPIGSDELDDAAAQQGVQLASGDVILLRTGHLDRWWSLESADDRLAWFGDEPGLGISCISWLYDHDVAAVAADTVGLEVKPNEDAEDLPLPIHRRGIVDLGLTLGELWDLKELADDCATDGQYEFLLVAPPLYIPNAVGSMLNPIAIK
jgi:kynurenine formamidase